MLKRDFVCGLEAFGGFFIWFWGKSFLLSSMCFFISTFLLHVDTPKSKSDCYHKVHVQTCEVLKSAFPTLNYSCSNTILHTSSLASSSLTTILVTRKRNKILNKQNEEMEQNSEIFKLLK